MCSSENILVMCSSETTGNLFKHIMVSDFCKKIANFCLTSPQHGRNVKLKKLHCKSPRFHAYFRKKSIFSSNEGIFWVWSIKGNVFVSKNCPRKVSEFVSRVHLEPSGGSGRGTRPQNSGDYYTLCMLWAL